MQTKRTTLILDIIEKIIKGKQKKHIDPEIALMLEIAQRAKQHGINYKEVKETINQLIKAGKIVYGKTINDFYFKIKKDENTINETIYP